MCRGVDSLTPVNEYILSDQGGGWGVGVELPNSAHVVGERGHDANVPTVSGFGFRAPSAGVWGVGLGVKGLGIPSKFMGCGCVRGHWSCVGL